MPQPTPPDGHRRRLRAAARNEGLLHVRLRHIGLKETTFSLRLVPFGWLLRWNFHRDRTIPRLSPNCRPFTAHTPP